MEPHQICKDNNILAIIMSMMAYNNNINTFSHSNNSTTSRHPPTSSNHFRPLPWPRQLQPCKGSQPPSTSRPCRPPAAAVAAVAHRQPPAALAEVTAGPVPTTSPAVTKVRPFKQQRRLRCSQERPLRPAAAPTVEIQIRGAGLNI